MIKCFFMVSNHGKEKPDINAGVLIFSLQPHKHKHTMQTFFSLARHLILETLISKHSPQVLSDNIKALNSAKFKSTRQHGRTSLCLTARAETTIDTEGDLIPLVSPQVETEIS